MARSWDAVLWGPRDFVDRLARSSPARLAVTAFAGIIAIFVALLSMPVATTSGQRAPFVDAVFTAVSAVSVTGLTTVPTGEYWSTWGHVVILLGIQIGGLGVMTLASVLGLAVSRHIGLTQKLLAASETKTARLGEVGSLIRTVVIASVTIETALALVLFPRFAMIEDDLGSAAWHSVFYSVSAFNNAGFVPTPDGLIPHYGDWWVLLPIIVGVFLGSLGFPVIMTLAAVWRTRKRWRRLNLHSRLTLVTSGGLVGLGALAIGAFEWNNPDTLGAQDGASRVLSALFAGVMPRSGGFATLDVGEMREATWLMTDALMFVGGGSASTAGGIKVTTLAVLVLAIIAEARGDRDVDVWGRRIPRSTLRLAVAVSFVGATIVLVSCLVLLELTDWTLDVVLFEVLSAFGTCGLSTGVTADLPDAGKYVISALMFVGRTGTMTVAAALALRERRRVIRYPEERPIIG
ncbi:MAG: TrkH family potassium uptake protein [Actinomycetales bacterium]|nr:TrkH family potassium uptake protein [Actinomycetales bacterium]